MGFINCCILTLIVALAITAYQFRRCWSNRSEVEPMEIIFLAVWLLMNYCGCFGLVMLVMFLLPRLRVI